MCVIFQTVSTGKVIGIILRLWLHIHCHFSKYTYQIQSNNICTDTVVVVFHMDYHQMKIRAWVTVAWLKDRGPGWLFQQWPPWWHVSLAFNILTISIFEQHTNFRLSVTNITNKWWIRPYCNNNSTGRLCPHWSMQYFVITFGQFST